MSRASVAHETASQSLTASAIATHYVEYFIIWERNRLISTPTYW